MLDYTKMAIKQTVSDLKKADYIRNVATQIIYIIYLIYTLIARTGYLAANIILLVLAVAYFAFFLTITSVGKTPEGKTVKKITTRIYVWCKRLIKLFTLGLTVYGICTAMEHVTPVSVILAALMIVGWLLQIIFEVLIKLVAGRINFILEGLEADLDNMMKPVHTVTNFFKKVTGKKITPKKELTKNQLKLKEKVEAYRVEQKQKKTDEKLRLEAERTAIKEQKREKKQSARIETKLLKQADKRHQQEQTADFTAETALSSAAEKDVEQTGKASVFTRFKNKIFQGNQNPAPDLSPEKEVFEEDAEPLSREEELLLESYINSEECNEEEAIETEHETDETNEADKTVEMYKTDEDASPDRQKSIFRSLFRKKS